MYCSNRVSNYFFHAEAETALKLKQKELRVLIKLFSSKNNVYLIRT